MDANNDVPWHRWYRNIKRSVKENKNCPDKLLNIHVTIKESKIFVPVILMEALIEMKQTGIDGKSNNSDRKVNSISFATSINFIPGNKE